VDVDVGQGPYPDNEEGSEERRESAPHVSMLSGRCTTSLPCHNLSRMNGRRAFVAVACLLWLQRAPVWAGEAARAVLDPQRVIWTDLRYTAHKMGISGTVEVRLDEARADVADAGGAGGRNSVSAEAPQREIVLESTSHLPGRTFLAHEHVNPVLAAASEIIDTETGAKNHRKTYILRERGFLFELLEPANASEALLAPERWTRQTRSFASYPKTLPADAVITGPAGLLYATSAGNLTAPGDSMTIYVLVQTQVERVVVEVDGVEGAEIDFEESSRGTVRSVREQVQALRLVARSQPVDPTMSSAFRLFGLEGDIEILWDAARRLPVEISGQLRMLGRVQVRLASVTLR
jgi:hypothetical protein